MSNDYSFQLGNYQTGQIETIKDLSFKQSIDKACEAVRKGQMFAVLHRDEIILHNMKRNIAVFVIGPNSLTRIQTELPTCGIYESIYAITGKSAAELGISSVSARQEYSIPDINHYLIANTNLPHYSYSELMGGKIVKETIGHQIFNVYFEGSKEFIALGQKIGLKRFATQWLYGLDYSNNQQFDYCCIDDSTCLLSSLNLPSNRRDGQYKVESGDKITWTEGINQFLHDKSMFLEPNFFYGFGKISEGQVLPLRSSNENDEELVFTSSIYKMVFADYQCMVNNQIFYDPYCALMKEDVDWLIRTQAKGDTTFSKNNAISCCKFNGGLCSPGEPEAKSKLVKIASDDLNYYNNLFNRMIMLGRKCIHYYLIPEDFMASKYTLLIGFSDTGCEFIPARIGKPNKLGMDKLGMDEKAIDKVAGTNVGAKPEQETKAELKQKEASDLINYLNRIHIYNAIYLNFEKETLPGGGKCAFAKYDIATVQIMKHYGELLTVKYFDSLKPPQSKKSGTLKEMFNLIRFYEG